MDILAPWQQKAHRIINELSAQAYRSANYFPDGTRRVKHVPYTIPSVASDLVECLNNNDEVRAKTIFMQLLMIPESATD